MTREELIAALEKAEAGSSELDHQIREFVEGWTNLGGGWRQLADGTRERWNYTLPCKPFTTSIDAALTLVPEGWRLQVFSEWDNDALRARGPWQAIIGRAGDGDCFAGKAHCDHAPTPALALCIAALEARA